MRQFILTIPTRNLDYHLSGQTLADYIRGELRSSGGHFLPGNWEHDILRDIKVTPVPLGKLAEVNSLARR